MEPRAVLMAAIAAACVMLAIRYRSELAGAIRRGPWSGNGPSGSGPLPAADPFGPPFARKKREKPAPPMA